MTAIDCSLLLALSLVEWKEYFKQPTFIIEYCIVELHVEKIEESNVFDMLPVSLDIQTLLKLFIIANCHSL